MEQINPSNVGNNYSKPPSKPLPPIPQKGAIKGKTVSNQQVSNKNRQDQIAGALKGVKDTSKKLTAGLQYKLTLKSEQESNISNLKEILQSNTYTKSTDLNDPEAVTDRIHELQKKAGLTFRPKIRKAIEDLQHLQMSQQNLRGTQRGIRNYDQRLEALNENFDPTTVDNAESWAAQEAKGIAPRNNGSKEALRDLFSGGPTPGAKILDLNEFSADDLIEFTANASPSELEEMKKSLDLAVGDDPRQAKIALAGNLTPRKAKAVRALVMKLLPGNEKIVSVDKDCFLHKSPKETRELMRALAADKAPEDLTSARHEIITLESNPQILEIIDSTELEERSPDLSAAENTAFEVSGKNPERLNTFKFQKQWAVINEKADESKRRGFEFSSDTSPKASAKRPNLSFRETENDSHPISSLKTVGEKEVEANSFTLPQVNLGDFTAHANGTIREGEDHLAHGCEDRMVLSAFSIQAGNQSINCMIPAVVDGHNGQQAAQFAQEHLAEEIEYELSQLENIDVETLGGQERVKVAIKKAFVSMSKKWDVEVAQDQTGAKGSSGADICCPVIIGGYIFTANMGDSKAALMTEDGVQYLTPDTEIGHGEFGIEGAMRGHLLKTKEETDQDTGLKSQELRISAVGKKAHLTIPTSRSFGDHHFNTSPVPIVGCVKIPNGGCQLLTMCDGFSDVASGKAITEYLEDNQGMSVTERNQQLHQKMANTGGGDDKTSVLVDIRPH